jgi:hypothetical protein
MADWTSNLIAGSAVAIAIWNGYISRQNARYSVEPALSIWADYPEGDNHTCEVVLSNKGFGPAVIESFAVFSDGNIVGGPMFQKVANAIRGTFGGYLNQIERVSSLERGHAMGSGDEIVIARFTVSPGLTRCGVDGMAQFMRRLSLVVRYRDIYHRRWAFAVHDFDGYTFRDAWWSRSYQRARRQLGSIITALPAGPLDDRKAR